MWPIFLCHNYVTICIIKAKGMLEWQKGSYHDLFSLACISLRWIWILRCSGKSLVHLSMCQSHQLKAFNFSLILTRSLELMFKNYNGKFNVMIKQFFLHISIKLLTKGYHVEFQPYRSSPAGVIEGYLERYNSVHTLFWHVPLLSHFKTLCIFQEIIFR